MDDLLTDAEALRESLENPARFALVYDRHVAAVHGYLRRRIGDESAEDLTAEAFVRAFRGRARYGVQHDTALPWLLGIASNLIGGHRRAERRRLGTLERLARSADRGEIERERAGVSPHLMHALRRLPNADRDALLLVVWGELSYEEAAQALDVPIGTVRSRIARARTRLAASHSVGRSTRPSGVVARGENHA